MTTTGKTSRARGRSISGDWASALPLALIAYGVYAIAMQQVTFGGRISMQLHGLNATAFGIAWVSGGVFVHCHYFWGNIFNEAWFAVLGNTDQV